MPDIEAQIAAVERESKWYEGKILTGPLSYREEAIEKASTLRAAAETLRGMRSTAALDVLAERRRQQTQEGWTEAHDGQWTKNELAFAGALYALSAAMNGGRQTIEAHHAITELWPWDRSWWKPTTRRRDLVKAGALIIAEIERIDRLSQEAPND